MTKRSKTWKKLAMSALQSNKLHLRAPLQPWVRPSKLWQRLHIDYAGPFMNKKFLIVVQVRKVVEVVEVTQTTTAKNIGAKKFVFTTWYPRTGNIRQWSTIYIYRLCGVHETGTY